jgi:hypothetical protein
MDVRLVTKDELDQVYKLTHDLYVQSGYATQQPSGLLKHYESIDNLLDTYVFGMFEQKELIGSVSFTLNNKVGLPVHESFTNHLEECRNSKVKCGICWRFVIKPKMFASPIKLIDSVIDIAMRELVTVLFIEINPKHEKVFQKLLSLQTIAGPIKDEAVNEAPAILMRGEIHPLIRSWLRFKNRG